MNTLHIGPELAQPLEVQDGQEITWYITGKAVTGDDGSVTVAVSSVEPNEAEEGGEMEEEEMAGAPPPVVPGIAEMAAKRARM